MDELRRYRRKYLEGPRRTAAPAPAVVQASPPPSATPTPALPPPSGNQALVPPAAQEPVLATHSAKRPGPVATGFGCLVMLGLVAGVVALIVWLVAGRDDSPGDEPSTSRCEDVATKAPISCEFDDGSPGQVIVASEMGDEWPLVVDGGVLHCASYGPGFGSVLFLSGDVTYAVNGDARTHARRNGWGDIEDIARSHPDDPGMQMSWQPLIDIALELCT